MTEIAPYKEALEEALYFKAINVNWLNCDSRYDLVKPTIWLEVLGLLETLHIIKIAQKQRLNDSKR